MIILTDCGHQIDISDELPYGLSWIEDETFFLMSLPVGSEGSELLCPACRKPLLLVRDQDCVIAQDLTERKIPREPSPGLRLSREQEQQIRILVGTRIVEARKAAGLSRRKVAQRAGTDVFTLQDIERGDSGVTLIRIGRIAKAMGVRVSDLFTEEDIPGEGEG